MIEKEELLIMTGMLYSTLLSIEDDLLHGSISESVHKICEAKRNLKPLLEKIYSKKEDKNMFKQNMELVILNSDKED